MNKMLAAAIKSEFMSKVGNCEVISLVPHGSSFVVSYVHSYSALGNKNIKQYRVMAFNNKLQCKFDCIAD